MNDFTKIKLINSLIDVVEKYYEHKNADQTQEATYLKGFCEGLAHTLMALSYLSKDETTKILKGLGKKRVYEEPKLPQEIPEENEPINQDKVYMPSTQSDDLDVPTFLRKKEP